MKTELQIKALAELDGCYFGNTTYDTEELWRKFDGCPCELPDYLTSYDAIIPLIQKQSDKIKTAVFELLQDSKETISVIAVWDATPAQLCEALLRATNKWIEL
jgi:hypothetical protein